MVEPSKTAQNYVQTDWLSEIEAAQYLGISRSTLRRWNKGGSGPGRFQYGGIVRYRRQALEAFIEHHSKAA
jgi:excisionase family DNA binding protein